MLSTIFVTLSAERWHFSEPFQISKNSIFATFPPTFPNRSPRTMPCRFSLSEAFFADEFPLNFSPILPVISPFRRNLRGDLGVNWCAFAQIHYFLSDNFDQVKHENGGLGDRKGRNWDFYSKNPLACGRLTGAGLWRILGAFTQQDKITFLHHSANVLKML